MRVIYTHPDQHLSIYTTEVPEEFATAVSACADADLHGGTWNAHAKNEHEDTTNNTNNTDNTADSSVGAQLPSVVVPTLADLLSNVPYASVVRDLEPQVEKLVKQRQLMVQAQATAIARRESRKRAILRTAAKWQSNMLHTNFVQWHNMTRTLKEQRVSLVAHFLKMHTPKLKDVFDAWHITAINDRLEACEEARDRTKNMMEDMREQLQESKNTEKELADNLKEQIDRKAALEKKLKETLAAIAAQKIPGTKEIMFAVANNFIRYARIVMREPKRLLDWAVKAPSVEKIARMYWVDREEKRMKEREAKAQEAMDEEAACQAEEKAIADAKKEKKEERARIATEKKRATAAAEAGKAAEEAFNERFEAAKAEYEALVKQAKKEAVERGEDEDGIAVPPFSPSELGLTMEIRQQEVAKAAALASGKVIKEEQEKQMKAEFALAEKAGEDAAQIATIIAEREKKFKEQQERRDNRISSSDVKEALRGMLSVPPDRLLLRWVKYHLRRSTRHGFPYRRKFMNFRNDIRDGVSYAVLMNKIAPETTKVNLDGEIDPQLRIDTMLEQCGRLDPPCVGFITRGHILGFEPFLNCAFVTRLFLSKHGLWIGEEHPQIKAARTALKELQTRWRAVMGTAQQLTDWDTWKKMRKKMRDIQLDDLMVRSIFFSFFFPSSPNHLELK